MKVTTVRCSNVNDAELDFENIYADFRAKIHRYLIRMVGEFEAEDLTQEVFVKVSQALPDFRGEAALSTWIYRIATNAALDRLRNPSFRQTVEDSSLGLLKEPDLSRMGVRHDWKGEKATSIEGQVFRQEMNDCLQGFIEKLPENYRSVLVLSEFEGLSNSEIAAILGVTLETVKIRLHRARSRLRRELATNCDSSWVEGNEFLPELKSND